MNIVERARLMESGLDGLRKAADKLKYHQKRSGYISGTMKALYPSKMDNLGYAGHVAGRYAKKIGAKARAAGTSIKNKMIKGMLNDGYYQNEHFKVPKNLVRAGAIAAAFKAGRMSRESEVSELMNLLEAADFVAGEKGVKDTRDFLTRLKGNHHQTYKKLLRMKDRIKNSYDEYGPKVKEFYGKYKKAGGIGAGITAAGIGAKKLYNHFTTKVVPPTALDRLKAHYGENKNAYHIGAGVVAGAAGLKYLHGRSKARRRREEEARRRRRRRM